MKFETKIEKQEKGIIKVVVNMPFEIVAEKKEKTFKKLSENFEIEGFRKGNVPEKILKEKISDDSVLQESAQEVINEVFPEILKKENLQIIGFPAINVTKLAEGNDFEFSIEMTVYPEVSLPDYKKIAASVKAVTKEIGDKDLKAVEKNVLDMLNHQAHHEANGGEHKHDEKIEEVYKELTDELVGKIGPFKTVAEFKEQVLKDLKQESEVRAIMDKRGEIAENILKEIKMEVPEILVNAELDKIIAQLKDDVQKQGIDWNQYLETSKKTEKDIKEEYKIEGEKRAKMEIVLKEIFREEKLETNQEEVKKQMTSIQAMHSDVDSENIKLYVENIMQNEEVMKFLENQ